MLQIFAKFIQSFCCFLNTKVPFWLRKANMATNTFFCVYVCFSLFSGMPTLDCRLNHVLEESNFICKILVGGGCWAMLDDCDGESSYIHIEVSHLWLRLLSSIFKDLDTRQTHNHFLMCHIYVTFNGRKYKIQIKSIIYIKYSIAIILEQDIFVSTCVISVSHSMHRSTGHKSNLFFILSIHLWSL